MTLREAAGHGRQANGGELADAGAALAPPVCDENAPDLYIPSMAFITYVLCVGLLKGMLKEFHPDVLVMVCSSSLFAHFLEVLLLQGTLYFFAPDSNILIVGSHPCSALSLFFHPSDSHNPALPTPYPLCITLAGSICLHGLHICRSRAEQSGRVDRRGCSLCDMFILHCVLAGLLFDVHPSVACEG